MFFPSLRWFSLLAHHSSSFLVYTFILTVVGEAVKIEKLIVPEVVQNGNSTILDCLYSGTSNQLVLQWLHSGYESPIYEWTPGTEPRVSEFIKNHLNLSFVSFDSSVEERRVLRIIAAEPELSGDYTCKVMDLGTEDHQTKTMLVFSPEKEFTLELFKSHREVDIKCTARCVYPQPEIILEHNGTMLPRQQLRMWRSEGPFYDAENTAVFTLPVPQVRPEQITCRLQIPQAGYTAIKKELLCEGTACTSTSSRTTVSSFHVILVSVAFFGGRR